MYTFIVNSYMQLNYIFCTEADDNINPRFRQYIKEKQFQLKDFGSYGLQNVLVVPAHQNKVVSKSSCMQTDLDIQASIC